MEFVFRNDAGDTLRFEVEEGSISLGDSVHTLRVTAEAAPVPQPSREEQREAQIAAWEAEDREETARRWAKTPKRATASGGTMHYAFWDGQRWQEFKAGEVPHISLLPDLDSEGYQGPPEEPATPEVPAPTVGFTRRGPQESPLGMD